MIKNKKKLVLNIFIGMFFLIGILAFYSTFSLETDYKIESLVYDIEDNYIDNISANTSIELFLKYFDLENCSIEVIKLNNDKITDGYVANGSKTVVYDVNGNVVATYINVIKGDYNSDGMIDNNDFYEMGKCLVSNCSLDEYLKKSVDIDNDGEFHINDLMLLDKAITGGYTDISLKEESIILQSEEQGRLVAKVSPSYGINQNLKWTSLDESIVTVDSAGRVTGHKVGTTQIKVSTLDGKISKEFSIKVDNTIQLLSTSGVGYVGGDDLVIGIKSINYEGLTCRVNNEAVAACSIQDKELVLKVKGSGNASVVVVSPNYGEITYNLTTYAVGFYVDPSYICVSPSGYYTHLFVFSMKGGELSFDISDNDIIKSAYMEYFPEKDQNKLRVNFGTKQGRATLKVTEGNSYKSSTVTVDISRLSFSDNGKVVKVGEEAKTTIIGHMSDDITCKSSDTSKGTCRIEGEQLIITPISAGFITIDVYNIFKFNGNTSDCGQTNYAYPVMIQE